MRLSSRFFVSILAGSLLLLASACTSGYLGRRLNLDLADEPTLYVFAWVDRNAPHVSVHPAEEAVVSPTVLMVPLRVTQRMGPGEADTMSRQISRTFSQTLLQEKIFPILEYDENAPLYSPAQSLYLARAKGAEMLIGGRITSVMSGGTAALSQVSMQIEAYDVASGELIWSITHAGNMDNKPSNDYVLFVQKTKLPPDPVYAITRALAWDISQIFKEWVAPDPNRKEPDDSGVLIQQEKTQNAF